MLKQLKATLDDKSSTLGLKILVVLAWGWVVAMVMLGSTRAFLVLAPVWFFLALSWLSVLLHSLDIRTKARRKWWLAASIAGLLGLGLAFSNIPILIRLALCESSLTKYANAANQHENNPNHPDLCALA